MGSVDALEAVSNVLALKCAAALDSRGRRSQKHRQRDMLMQSSDPSNRHREIHFDPALRFPTTEYRRHFERYTHFSSSDLAPITWRRPSPHRTTHRITSHCAADNATSRQIAGLAVAAASSFYSLGPSQWCALSRSEARPHRRQRLCVDCVQGCHKLGPWCRMLAHRPQRLDLVTRANPGASESRSRFQRSPREPRRLWKSRSLSCSNRFSRPHQ